MITYVVSDLFTSPAKVLVNTVNTVGVMGKGIALDFKRIYPEMFQEYQYYCENNMFDVGELWLYKSSHKWILNFPTKRHWRSKSKVEYIEAGLQKFVDTYDSKGMVSVSFPMLGCGNGELDWSSEVKPMMERYLRRLPIDIYIHIHHPAEQFVPEHRQVQEVKKWLRNEPRHLPFTELWDDIVHLTFAMEEFRTMDENAPFKVSSDLFGQNLRFDYDTHSFEISKESFEDMWNRIRPSGYYAIRDLNIDTADFANVVASFLLHLPYIRPAKISYMADAAQLELGLLLTSQSNERAKETHMVHSA